MLAYAARHARLLLIAGLVAGLLLPSVALAMRPWLPQMVAALLFIAALRLGPRQIIGAAGDMRGALLGVLVLQLALPLAIVLTALALGVAATPLAMALVLMTSAGAISGAPGLAIIMGADPAPAMRLLVIGTALVPLTILPVLWLLPALGEASAILATAARLLLVIGAATAAALAVRAWLLRNPAPQTIAALDGLGAIAMAVIVVGLMSALGPALRDEPLRALAWLGAAAGANLGLQALAFLALRARGSAAAVPTAIVAGNRNIALFLAAMPESVTTPLLLFIGCYQVPMYLTPVIMAPLYRRVRPASA